MEMRQPTYGNARESTGAFHQIPHTPPYTPHRAKKRFERSDSPASVSSIQPAETTSPAKRAAKRNSSDDVKVEELVEGDAGYVSDIDVVYPEELEEKASSDDETDSSGDTDDDSDTGITHRFQELSCHDSPEAEFERKRMQNRLRKRTSSRLFKRSHSQSIKCDSEMSDAEAKDDHDLHSSARRLRRRVRGPSGIEVLDDAPRSSPEPNSAGLAPAFQMRERARVSRTESDSSADSDSDDDAMDER